MAAMVHYFRLTPDGYWNTDIRDIVALNRLHDKHVQQAQQQK